MVEKDKIEKLLSRNVAEIIEKKHLEERIKKGEKLRIKLGIDPTGPRLHIGRAVALRKLKEFQDLGHRVVLITGDFTGLVGDASDKESQRPQLTREQLEENMKDYEEQIGKILDLDKVEFRYNSEWLSKIKFEELLRLASLFTIHQLVERRNFKERFESGKTIGFHEFFYPLMQGYDSVAVEADVEIGGTDQLFNLLAGRKIQEFYGQKPQDVMILDMMVGLDARKMSTTYRNVINMLDEPNDMFGKVMSLKDELIPGYFVLATDVSMDEIKKIEESIKKNEVNPMEVKKQLAFEIVKIYHGEDKATKARAYFEKTFQQGKTTEIDASIETAKGKELREDLISAGYVVSSSEFRRLVKEGAIDFEGEIVDDVHYKIEKPGVVRIGKKKFVKIEI
ncbi:MAG: tyrosine--tRNA ligase [Candidatus Tagabacteria bacterium CG09_land_8_20_14_0_10_41_14]|uniref:Tyrosine--tRNA ligase n=1 Tax=Candidatus Tagabacteria bacterium CG09_land_8_20_14_0_10_41_14 TaxID=1975021 RepID=A0A2H0WN41_9BACT|nr:MAG: tyrosine--tRNA ligase [Candidatus Tagabacteria bacterium CG09_land_8_20_14_0_10_41_14]